MLNGDGGQAFDRTWVEKSKKEAAVGLDRLETELKGYTTNLIKESIRVCSCCVAPLSGIFLTS